MEYRITLTVNTDDISQGAWPDETIEVGAVVNILSEGGEEVIGRVVGIRYERIEV